MRGSDSFGVNIVLPFEQKASPVIEGDAKLATFRYFFTRKLFFMKGDAFVVFPGGFGTLDETFELLTLIQTVSYPAPIVLLDHAGSTYWQSLRHFIDTELLDRSMIRMEDTNLFLQTHDAAAAADYVCGFYSAFHSMRYVGHRLVLRLNSPLSADALDTLNTEFADIVTSGEIEPIDATAAEVKDDDHLDRARLAFAFDNRSFARLTMLIHRINELHGEPQANAAQWLVHDLEPEPEAYDY
ncbi:MAG: LOG family protein [Acidimicrobiales bacterium]